MDSFCTVLPRTEKRCHAGWKPGPGQYVSLWVAVTNYVFCHLIYLQFYWQPQSKNTSRVSEKPLETVPMDFIDGGWYVACHRQFWNCRWEYRPCACQVTGMTRPLSIFVQRSLLKWKRCQVKKIRTSREKNELPTRSLLAKRSPSGRDRMDGKVACTVDTTPYTASINGGQPNPNRNPTFYHNQYMPNPNLN